MSWNMQIFPPGIFFQVEIFPKKSKWIYSKIPPEIYLEKCHLVKKSSWNIYKPLGHPSNY